jgi:hypothetical protein
VKSGWKQAERQSAGRETLEKIATEHRKLKGPVSPW